MDAPDDAEAFCFFLAFGIDIPLDEPSSQDGRTAATETSRQ